MNYPPLPAVECAILHDEFAPIDGQIIFDFIAQRAIELGFGSDVQLMATSSDKDIHIHAGGHRILVSQNPQPLGMEGFRMALTTPYTGFTLPNATEIVQRHQANTFVTVGKGVLPLEAPEISNMLADMLGDDFREQLGSTQFTEKDETFQAMILCRDITSFILKHHAASAVHWCTSDNLVPQSFFEGFADQDSFLMLGSRPFLHSSANRIGDGLPLGATFNGTQWLIGKMVKFEEATVPFPWMMEVVMGFINMCQVRGAIIPHNESFSVEGEDWTIGVYHEPAIEGTSWEFVNLVVVNAPEFGIHGDVTAKQRLFYESEEEMRAQAEKESREVRAANDVTLEEPNILDPENDLDLAILEKLRLKQLKEEQAASVDDARSFKAPEQEVWQEPTKKADIAALRNLARQAQDGKLDAQQDAQEKSGFVSKVSRLFGR